MINGKNMFTYKVRKIGPQKELGSIIPDDPSNIFEFTNRKRKMVNFNDLLFKGIKKSDPLQIDFSSSTSVKGNRNVRGSLNRNVKENENTRVCSNSNENRNVRENENRNERINLNKIDIRNTRENENINLRGSSNRNDIRNTRENENRNKRINLNKNKKDINVIKIKEAINDCIKINSPISERKDLSISECSNINDLLFSFTKKDKSDYSMKLRNILEKDKNLFNNIFEEECKRIELEIEKIDIQSDKWCKIKEKVIKDNILENYTINTEENTNLIKSENKMEEIETYKFKFLKENMKTFLSNLNEKINEVEQKIFNLTANDKEMDPLIILNAFTKYN